MDLINALGLLLAIADEGSATYEEEYKNGEVAKAIDAVSKLHCTLIDIEGCEE